VAPVVFVAAHSFRKFRDESGSVAANGPHDREVKYLFRRTRPEVKFAIQNEICRIGL
jgi:hypothetical protein